MGIHLLNAAVISGERRSAKGQGQQNPSSTDFDPQVMLGKTQYPEKNS